MHSVRCRVTLAQLENNHEDLSHVSLSLVLLTYTVTSIITFSLFVNEFNVKNEDHDSLH